MVYIIMVQWCVIGDCLYRHGRGVSLLMMVDIIMILLCVIGDV